jgi:leucyl aminopeptidase
VPHLPRVVLASALPDAEAIAVPTRSAGKDATPELLGSVDFDGSAFLAREKAKGDAGELVVAPVVDQKLLLIGTGDGSPAALRKTGATLVRRNKTASSLALDLRGMAIDAAGLRALVVGLSLGGYWFSKKESAEPPALRAITVVVAKPAALKQALAEALVVAAATAACRDLVNTPPLEKSPQWFATQATSLLKGLSVKVRDE